MAEELSFESLKDLKKYVGQNYTVVESLGNNSTNNISASNRRTKIVTRTKARKIANALKTDIRAACSAPPFNLHSIFDQLYILDGENPGQLIVYIPFSAKSYRESKFEKDKHYSFMPILMDQGWLTKFATQEQKQRGLTRPTFGYFVGTGELSRVIREFNSKHRRQGYHVSIEYDESALGWIPGQYITKL